MITKTVKLSEQELQQYVQLESSIQHWSVEHTKAQLQADRLKGAVGSMYDGRIQLINNVMKSHDVDPAHVHQVHVNTDSHEVTISYDESVPNPAADPSESGVISPTAKSI